MSTRIQGRGAHGHPGNHGDISSSSFKTTSKAAKQPAKAAETSSPVSEVLGRVLEHLNKPGNKNSPGKAYNASIEALSFTMENATLSGEDRGLLSDAKTRLEKAYESRDSDAKNRQSRKYTQVVKSITSVYKRVELSKKN